jgi:hypothetical protein
MAQTGGDMVRLAVRIFTIVFALVGLGTVAGWVWPSLRGAPPAPNDIAVVVSPDGEFKAVLASWNGGGAIAPFCYDRVFVVPKATAADQAVDDENVVFEGVCGSFALKDGVINSSPQLSWRDARVLVVRFSTNATAASPEKFRLRRLVAQGQVAVEFEVGH